MNINTGLCWYEVEWLAPGGTWVDGQVGDRADTGAGWACARSGDWVLADPFRAHVRHLLAGHRMAWRTAGLLAGVPAAAMDHLLHGRNGRPQRRLHPVLARRLFQLSDRDIGSARIRLMPADTCRAALQDLLQWGWTGADLARRTGLSHGYLAAIVQGRRTRCTLLAGATTLAAAQALRTRSSAR